MTAADLFRDVGLMPDGPAAWGRPVGARGPGVFVVELGAPLASAPIELTRVGKWLERVPGLRLDGSRPTSRSLASRLAAFWLPSQVVVYVGSAETSLARRVAAIEATPLGERRPHPGGNWLRTLALPPTTRVWWANTDAVEEYEDALLGAFAAAVPVDERALTPDPDVVLPFANLRRPTGERRRTGLTGTLVPAPAPSAPVPTRVVVIPDGDAEGARGEPPEPRRARAPRAESSRPGATGARGVAPRARPATTRAPAPPPVLTADGAARLRAELEELMGRRPEVVARIRTAKEHGDLKENAEYTAAREEQSFLEGRIQALEARLRGAVIATPPSHGGGADLGSVVTVEADGQEATYTLVGSAEADPRTGRLSVDSPVGRALVGAMAGDEVEVRTPRGPVRYRVIVVG